MELVKDIWSSLRPYLVYIITDIIISMALWMFLWLFKQITLLFPIDGWAGEWITNIHSLGAILAFCTFGILFFVDIIKHHLGDR